MRQIPRHPKATVTYGHDICLSLFSAHQNASVASQPLALLVQVLTETHTICDDSWIARIQELGRLKLHQLLADHSWFLSEYLAGDDAVPSPPAAISKAKDDNGASEEFTALICRATYTTASRFRHLCCGF